MSAKSVLLCARLSTKVTLRLSIHSCCHIHLSLLSSFSFLQAQCSDFPQYEIIEQAPKGRDGETMEAGREGDVKEVPTEREGKTNMRFCL